MEYKWENMNTPSNQFIEKRKFLIEHYLQTLFANEEFQENPNKNVLEKMGLPKNFFQLIAD